MSEHERSTPVIDPDGRVAGEGDGQAPIGEQERGPDSEELVGGIARSFPHHQRRSGAQAQRRSRRDGRRSRGLRPAAGSKRQENAGGHGPHGAGIALVDAASSSRAHYGNPNSHVTGSLLPTSTPLSPGDTRTHLLASLSEYER